MKIPDYLLDDCKLVGTVIKVYTGENKDDPFDNYGEILVEVGKYRTVRVDVWVGGLPNIKTEDDMKSLLGKRVRIEAFPSLLLAENLEILIIT